VLGEHGCKRTYLVVTKAVSFSYEDVNGGIQADNPSKNELIIQTAQEYRKLRNRDGGLLKRLREVIANQFWPALFYTK
jgi:hypothetical protein